MFFPDCVRYDNYMKANWSIKVSRHQELKTNIGVVWRCPSNLFRTANRCS